MDIKCNICQELIPLAVCDSVVLHICEDENEYTCMSCYRNKYHTQYLIEESQRKLLERIIIQINKRSD